MKFDIITGSMLGTSEYAAQAVAAVCEKEDLEFTIFNGPDYNDVKDATHLLVITSTHGEGDYPDNFQEFVSAVAEQDQPFAKDIRILLIGIGSKEYDTFCFAIKKFKALLEEKGYGDNIVCDPLLIDVSDYSLDPEDLSAEFFTEHKDEFLK